MSDPAGHGVEIFELADPYPAYRELRACDGLPAAAPGVWFLPRAADLSIAKDERCLSSDIRRWRGYHASERSLPSLRWREDNLLTMDGDDHGRLRRTFGDALRQSRVTRIRRSVEELAESLLDDAAAAACGGSIDVVSAFAYPFAGSVICDLIGIPREMRSSCVAWSRALAPVLGMTIKLKTAVVANRGIVAMREYLRGLVAERREAPQQDFLAELIQSVDEGYLTEAELVDNLVLLFGAGYETTANSIVNGLFALLGDESQLRRFAELTQAGACPVDAVLRHDSSVQATCRVATVPLEVRGTKVEEGDLVILLLASANHELNEDGALDVDAPSSQHWSFGIGPHRCPGAALARTEVEVALRHLVGRRPRLAVPAESLEWRADSFFRGLRSLPVTFEG